jgi:exopolysaccharide biosynthesis polyprenyl glycosylphosphotransferase
MIRQRTLGIFVLHHLLVALIAAAIFWGDFFLFHRIFKISLLGPVFYAPYCISAMIGIFFAAVHGYNRNDRFPVLAILTVARLSLQQLAYAGGAIVLYLVFAKDQAISRVFLAAYLLTLYPAFLLVNRLLPAWLCHQLFQGARVEPTLLVGNPSDLAALQQWLKEKQWIGIQTIGAVAVGPTTDNHPPISVPFLGNWEDIPRIIRKHQVTQVLVADLFSLANRMRYLSLLCEKLGVRILVVSRLDRLFQHPVTLMEDSGLTFLGLRPEPLENPLNRSFKRLFDVLIAFPVVYFVLPFITAAVWTLQRFQSPGPVFFNQERLGLQNRPFSIVKYRTMHPNNPNEARQATSTDARVFSAGRWLRRLSVDELPQFINVLKGEMSVVGPRPHLTEHNKMFAQAMDNYHIRATVKPGITGLAQVRGFRGEIISADELKRRLESDIYYLENWNLGLDVLIVLRTIWQLVAPPKKAF